MRLQWLENVQEKQARRHVSRSGSDAACLAARSPSVPCATIAGALTSVRSVLGPRIVIIIDDAADLPDYTHSIGNPSRAVVIRGRSRRASGMLTCAAYPLGRPAVQWCGSIGAMLTLRDVVVQGCHSGVLQALFTTVTMERVVVTNWTASLGSDTATTPSLRSLGSSGVVLQSSTLEMMDTELTPTSGVGSVLRGVAAVDSVVNLTRCTITGDGMGVIDGNGGAVSMSVSSIMRCALSTLTMQGCRVSGCGARSGGAVYAGTSRVAMSDCVLSGNTAAAGSGGAVLVTSFSDLTMTGVTCGNNTATGDGGCLAQLVSSTATVADSRVWNNTAGAGSAVAGSAVVRVPVAGAVGTGGGVYVGPGAATVASATQFVGNSAVAGGGVFVSASSDSVRLAGCAVRGNTAATGGGGLAVITGSESSAATVTNSTISGNTAVLDCGGGVYWDGSVASVDQAIVLSDVVVDGNRAAQGGGGLYVYSTALPPLSASTPNGTYSSPSTNTAAYGAAAATSPAGLRRAIAGARCDGAPSGDRRCGDAAELSLADLRTAVSWHVVDGSVQPQSVTAGADATCSVTLATPGVSIGNAVQRSAAGLVSFPTVGIAGVVGELYTGSVSCSVGSLPLPPAPFTVRIPLCGPGTQPTGLRTDCEPCPAGRYGADGQYCTPCAVGTVSADGGASVCTGCPRGTASTADRTSCALCAAGTYSVNGTSCEPCGPGTFTASSGDGSCQSCAAGYVATQSRTGCVACAAGSATRDGDTCHACVAGRYASEAGQAACLPCPLNTFAAGDGASACVPCTSLDPNMVTAAGGGASPLACVCQSGYFYHSAVDGGVAGLDAFSLCHACGDTDGLDCSGGNDTGGVGPIGLTLETVPVLPGYWRATNVSLAVLSCRVDDVCGGGEVVDGAADAVCSGNHTGPLCELCAKGFSLQGAVCVACESNRLLTLTAAGAVAVTLAALAVCAAVAARAGLLAKLVTRVKALVPTALTALSKDHRREHLMTKVKIVISFFQVGRCGEFSALWACG